MRTWIPVQQIPPHTTPPCHVWNRVRPCHQAHPRGSARAEWVSGATQTCLAWGRGRARRGREVSLTAPVSASSRCPGLVGRGRGWCGLRFPLFSGVLRNDGEHRLAPGNKPQGPACGRRPDSTFTGGTEPPGQAGCAEQPAQWARPWTTDTRPRLPARGSRTCRPPSQTSSRSSQRRPA